MDDAHKIYSGEVQGLSATEQLRLATMILQGLTSKATRAADFSDAWSDEDIKDLSEFTAKYAAESLGEE